MSETNYYILAKSLAWLLRRLGHPAQLLAKTGPVASLPVVNGERSVIRLGKVALLVRTDLDGEIGTHLGHR